MKLDKLLQEFYIRNGLPPNGGINNNGIIDLELSNSELMKMELNALVCITQKKQIEKMGVCRYIEFISWVFISLVVFLSPLIITFVVFFYSIKA